MPLTVCYHFRIYKETIGPVLYDWRQPRGFDKTSLHIQLGNIKI